MQNEKTTIQLITACLLALSITACGGDEFTKLIEKSRAKKLDQVQAASAGLPFFAPGTLDPVWQPDVPVVRMGAMKLTDQLGAVRDSSLFQGKISFVAFFFASCKGFCPVMVRNIKDVASNVRGIPNAQFVLLTVDPEHDTPAVLKNFAQRMKIEDWTLLTGPQSEIYAIARETFANQAFQRKSDGTERNFVHSENLYVIDTEGRLRAVLNANRQGQAAEAFRVARELSGVVDAVARR